MARAFKLRESGNHHPGTHETQLSANILHENEPAPMPNIASADTSITNAWGLIRGLAAGKLTTGAL
jgi:hypothetical protein